MNLVRQLPLGWVHASVADLCQFNPKTNSDPEISCGFVPMAALGTRFREALKFEIRPWGEVRSTYTHFQNGDVLVAKVTPCFENGKAGVVTNLPNGIGAGSSEFCVFRPSELIEAKYLLAWFSSEAFRRHATVSMTGSVGLKRVPKDVFISEKISLPPKAEQKRIVEKLDLVLARVDSVNVRLARITPLLKRFRQSVLAAATSGRLTEDWRKTHCSVQAIETTLQAICVKDRVITYGVVKLGEETLGGVPCLRTSNVRWLRFEVDGIKLIDPRISEDYGRTVLRGGEVLVNVRGTLGGVAVVSPAMIGWNVSREVAVVPIDEKWAISEFIAFWIAGEACQRWLTGVAKGVAYTGINIEDLRALPLKLPPKDEQAEIIRRVETLFAFADRLEARLQAAQTSATRLTPSLLAKAFRGELVPQDPDDEPAAELLKRLAEARPAGKVAKKRQGETTTQVTAV
ncbi:restriction endonuclease subunit S [Curvibacter gracilis]|uniref:restriction endonuclease subunit S n=1 Tax=Curvibacter gracilis TaxID=230310 RepID=UPI0004AF4633|nr:restriction endonuclease subunit S [Curvibacter gracilis]